MNKRIHQKIYKRAENKLLTYIKKHHDKRSTYAIAKSESILSPIERVVFLKEQNRRIMLFNQIKNELIEENKW